MSHPRPATMDSVLRQWPFAVGLLLTLSLLWPLMAAPYFSHDDNVQTMRIFEMRACLADGQIPCRWVADLGGGYGYPEYNFYAPLAYYVGAGYYQLSQDLIVASKLTFATGFVLAFPTMFLVGRKLWGTLGGSLAAILYVFAPYHALNMYHRGAMGELWAVALVPLVFWAYLRLREYPSGWGSLLLGGTLAALIVTHNLTALLVLGTLAVLVLVQGRLRRDGAYLALAGACGFALSAFYLLPMVAENGLVHLETLTRGEYNYAQHFQNWDDLFVERAWWSPGNTSGVAHQIGTVHVVVWALAAVAAISLWRSNRQLRFIVAAASVLIVASVFMMLPASRVIWDRVPDMSLLQFPWRLMTLVSLATSLLGGAVLLLAQRSRARLLLVWSVLVTMVVLVNVGWFRPDRFLYVDQAQLLTGAGWDNLRMFAIGDFLPKVAQDAPSKPSTALVEASSSSGEPEIKAAEAGSDWVRFSVSSTSLAQLQILKFDFPEWAVTVDGYAVAHGHDAQSGLIELSVPAGSHLVEAHLRDTPVRVVGNMLTVSALLVCALMCVRALLRTHLRARLPREQALAASELVRETRSARRA